MGKKKTRVASAGKGRAESSQSYHSATESSNGVETFIASARVILSDGKIARVKFRCNFPAGEVPDWALRMAGEGGADGDEEKAG